MNTNNVIIQNLNLSHVGLNRQILKDGSQVLVRIIRDKGNGKYEGSVAGNRINIKSNKVFSKGDSFIANIKLDKGNVRLIPLNDASKKISEGINISLIDNLVQSENIKNIVSSPELFNFMQNLGLYPDNLNLNILLNFKQLGLKFESSIINKFHDIALKFVGKEKKTVELMINHYSKGIDVSYDSILKLINELYEDDTKKERSKNDYVFQNTFTKNKIEDFFYSVFNNLSCLDNNELKYGLLSISNNLGLKKDISGNGSWVLLPYEIVKENDRIAYGIFRILLSNEKKIIKFCSECNYGLYEANFCIMYEKGNCKSVKVNVQFENNDIKDKNNYIFKIKNKMKENKLDFLVEWAEKDKISDNTSNMEDMCFFGGLL